MKKFVKSIITLSLITILSLNCFAAVLYSPGANILNGPNPITSDTEASPLTGTSVLNKETVENVSKIIVSQQAEQANVAQSNIINIAQGVDSPSASIPTTAPIINGTLPQNGNVTSYSVYQQANVTVPVPTVQAPAYIVVNANTKQIYAGKEINTKYEPAGIVNLMTAYLGSINKPYDAVLSCNLPALKAVDKDASIAGLDGGDKITLNDAIAAMFVRSCADCANVIADNVSGNVASFVELMNNTAKTFGCQNTNFINPSGLNNDAQLTTAYDMALIMDRVTNDQNLINLLSLSQYTLPAAKRRDKLILFSKNTILNKESPNYNADVTCSRMGYTSKTGYTMASMCNYKGNRLIVIILQAKGSHFDDTKKLIDFAKLAYEETK